MQTCCHWPANIYFFFLASKIGRSLWLLGRFVDWLVGWFVGWLVGDVFVLSWLSSATTIEEGTRKEPNINQQSNLLLVLSRSTAEQAQSSVNWQLFHCYCLCSLNTWRKTVMIERWENLLYDCSRKIDIEFKWEKASALFRCSSAYCEREIKVFAFCCRHPTKVEQGEQKYPPLLIQY